MPSQTDEVVVPESRGGSLTEENVEWVTRAFAKGRGFLKEAEKATEKFRNRSNDKVVEETPPITSGGLDESGQNLESAGITANEEAELDNILDGVEEDLTDSGPSGLESEIDNSPEPSKFESFSESAPTDKEFEDYESEEEWLKQFDSGPSTRQTSSQYHQGLYTRNSSRKINSFHDPKSLIPPEQQSQAEKNSREWKDKGNKYIRTEDGGMKVVKPGDPDYPKN